MTTEARALTQCAQCGQTDDHPKIHLGEVTRHHDCLPFADRQIVADSSPVALTIIEACEGGLRGDDLLAMIRDIHSEA